MNKNEILSPALRIAQLEKELEIEVSLELVRTVAMGMRKPDDLLSICKALFEELQKLGFSELRNSMINILHDDKNFMLNYDYTYDAGPTVTTFLYNTHPVIDNQIAMTRAAVDAFIEFAFEGQNLEDFKAYRVQNGELPDPKLENIDSLHYFFYSIGVGSLGISTFSPLSEEKRIVLKRFRNVFDLAYGRYIDIANAEAQAHEAQIEASLERVRAIAMGMRKSEEVINVCETLYKELSGLGFKNIRNAQIAINNDEKQTYSAFEYAGYGATIKEAPYDTHKLLQEIEIEVKRSNEALFQKQITGEELDDWRAWRKRVGLLTEERLEQANAMCFYFYSIGMGMLGISTYDTISADQFETLKRFKNVFALAYRRYTDVSRAEAQAREAQIELALERVRARTMAMQHSNELAETAFILFQQFRELGENPDQATIGIINKAEGVIEYWVTMYGNKNDSVYKFSIDEPNVTNRIYKAWQAHEKSLVIDLAGKELIDFSNYRQSMGGAAYNPEEQRRIINVAFFSKGLINVQSTAERSVASLQLLERFANVFESTYTRFLDLKNAEAQAREAQIELSLERVRAKTMAMYNSSDIDDVVIMLFDELLKLGAEKTIRCGVNIFNDSRQGEVWSASFLESGETSLTKGFIDMGMHPLLIDIYKAWQNHHPNFTQELSGLGLEKYYEALIASPDYPFEHKIAELPKKQVTSAFFFPEGCLFAFTAELLPANVIHLFTRFAGVFGLTYRRFLDLQRAEAQAREAQIETSLERVRSRTLAMQSSDELAETAAVLFRQLIELGIEPNRLFIGIIGDGSGNVELWATDEDGSKVSTRFTGHVNANKSVKEMYDGWKNGKSSLTIDMTGKVLKDYFHYLSDTLHVPFKLGLTQKRRIQSIAYFSQGFIGMASPDEQPPATISLLERFAGVFNLTYTRFNDLKIAEAHAIQAKQDLILLQTEKKRAEDALLELKTAQTQLVQKEKMALLGELTAGIAHEIQNPLNFVNNFSEVNTELIDELKEEIAIGNLQEAEAIANDIKENAQKITMHGKRADNIVKGMLEHSRTRSGQKVPTNINSLVDEYMRLSYHGLRAKDKTFNAEMNTDFDPNLPKISVVAQDIGRVILNLFNNAFYAVNQKKKTADKSYRPEVTVIISSANGYVTITVKDNGTGMPTHVKEKIMQPFFTTKPTGEGTGLGLSLTYDMVVKGHGGTIQVNSVDGEGSEFIIMLPVN